MAAAESAAGSEPPNPRCLNVWSGPRCLSTSLMYAFAQRGDCAVVDEPLYAHYLRCSGAPRPYRDAVLAAQDNDGERVFRALLRPREAPRAYTYSKHMAKQALLLPPALLARGRHVLLVREPEALVRSFARVLPPTLEETALPNLVALLSALRSAGAAAPVILSEDLATQPEATLRLMCGALGLPYDAAMLSWPAGARPEDGLWAPWWYASTHASTGFAAPAASSSAAPLPPLSPALAALVEECGPFYALLKKHALRPPAMGDVAAAAATPVDVGLAAPAAPAGGAHQGATHAFAADARNAAVLVGIRDGVRNAFELHARPHARVSVLDAGFVLGDGVSEGLRLRAGVVQFAKQHLRRLREGAAALDMELGATSQQLLRMVYAVVDANGMRDDVHIRLMVTRGLKPTPYQDPRTTIGLPTIVVLAEWKAPQPPRAGLRLATVHVRRGAPDVQDASWNSHSKLNCISACIAAAKAGADEGLMLDPQGFVATCNSTNFCIVRDGELWAPTAKYQMPGITRAVVLRVAAAAGITVRELEFSLTAVYGADEAFCTGTFAGLLPVASVDGRVIGACGAAAQPSALTARLLQLYAQAVEEDVASGRDY